MRKEAPYSLMRLGVWFRVFFREILARDWVVLKMELLTYFNILSTRQ